VLLAIPVPSLGRLRCRLDGPDYLQGDYTLAERSDGVQLAIGAARS
jgi:hypothetical protein